MGCSVPIHCQECGTVLSDDCENIWCDRCKQGHMFQAITDEDLDADYDEGAGYCVGYPSRYGSAFPVDSELSDAQERGLDVYVPWG